MIELRYMVMMLLEIARELSVGANRADLEAQCQECMTALHDAAPVVPDEVKDNG